MKKILGCFKIVPDLDLLTEEDWKADDRNLVDTSFVKTQWNCFDESGLEMMLKLSEESESFGVSYELDALTISGELGEKYLKTLYALGFEKAVRIECEKELQFQPDLTAGLIAEYVSQRGGQEILIMGRQSSDGASGKTPLLVSEQLGWPCVTQVTKIEPADEEHIKVTCFEDGGTCTKTVPVPCVLSIGDVPGTYLRVPTLKDRMKKGKCPVEVINAGELDTGDGEPSEVLTALEPVSQAREGVFIKGESPEETAEILYESYLKGRLEKL